MIRTTESSKPWKRLLRFKWNSPGWSAIRNAEGDHRHYPNKGSQVCLIWEFSDQESVYDLFCLQTRVCGHTLSYVECRIISELIRQRHIK